MIKYFFLFFFLSCLYNTKAQKIEDKIVSALDSFSLIRPQEKAYLQTDRNVYMSGEAIYFKAYVLLDEKPTILSKIVYVELVNTDGKIVDKKMLKLLNGTASASFDVKQINNSADYFLRCYTLWMMNFPDFIFEKKIHVVTTSLKSFSTGVLLSNITCDFFPEGGDMVNGIKNKVAFKASLFGYENNKFSGVLVDNDNNKIDSFKSIHNGMGYFEFVPSQGKSYKIQMTSFAVVQTFALPAAKNEGGHYCC